MAILQKGQNDETTMLTFIYQDDDTTMVISPVRRSKDDDTTVVIPHQSKNEAIDRWRSNIGYSSSIKEVR